MSVHRAETIEANRLRVSGGSMDARSTSEPSKVHGANASLVEPSRRNSLSRRDVLRAGLVGCVATPLLSRGTECYSAAEQNAESGFIDAHVHVWTPDTDSFPLADGFAKADMQPASFTPEELLEHAQPVGVTRVVLIQMSYYGFDNTYMLKVIRDAPGRYVGVAVVNEHDRPTVTMKSLAGQGVTGFRIRPGEDSPERWLTSDGMQAMWRCGADEGLAMCHLIDARFLPAVERQCQRFPRTPVVIDHFARIGIDGEIRQHDLESLCRLARFPQVSVKVSAFYALGHKRIPYRDLGPMIQQLRDAFGAERLMWASDCPFQVQSGHTYQASIDLVKHGLDFLTADDKLWILSKTAEKVLFRT